MNHNSCICHCKRHKKGNAYVRRPGRNIFLIRELLRLFQNGWKTFPTVGTMCRFSTIGHHLDEILVHCETVKPNWKRVFIKSREEGCSLRAI